MLACKGLKLLFVQIFAYKHNVGVALGELVDRVAVPLHDLELRVGYGLKDGELAGEQEALHHELHAAGISLDNACALLHHHVVGAHHPFDLAKKDHPQFGERKPSVGRLLEQLGPQFGFDGLDVGA